jgi:hypothetical protein
MSAMGQKRTHAAQQKGSLFDRLIGAAQQRERHSEAERAALDEPQMRGTIDAVYLRPRRRVLRSGFF